jgi:hypothetical protein
MFCNLQVDLGRKVYEYVIEPTELRTDLPIDPTKLILYELAQNPSALSYIKNLPFRDCIDDLHWNLSPSIKYFLEQHGLPLPDSDIMMTHPSAFHEDIIDLLHNSNKMVSGNPSKLCSIVLHYPRIKYCIDEIYKLCTDRILFKCQFSEHAIPLIPYLLKKYKVPPDDSYFWHMISTYKESFEYGLLKEGDPRINLKRLCENTHPIAIKIITQRLDDPFICWKSLCENKEAHSIIIPLLKDPYDSRLHWSNLSRNSSLELIQEIERRGLISFYCEIGCSLNTNPYMKHILEQYPQLKHTYSLLKNHSYDTLSLVPWKEVLHCPKYKDILYHMISIHPFLFVAKKNIIPFYESYV